jgi:phosphate:Na+ symporter
LALAYILFKLIAALIALVLFPVTIPLLVHASKTIDGVTLLAGYHTAYNVVGVAVLLPIIHKFTALVERILPERGSPLTRCLDRAALLTPLAAEEAVRRTVARALETLCGAIGVALTAARYGTSARPGRDAPSIAEAGDALRQAQQFFSEANGPPESEEEQERLTRTLHALDHASRLADVAGEEGEFGSAPIGSEDVRAVSLCADAMRSAVVIAGEVGALPDDDDRVANGTPTEQAVLQLEECAKALDELQRVHRKVTLSSVASGTLTADEAIARVDTVRRLEAIAHHAWRSAGYLVMYPLPPS